MTSFSMDEQSTILNSTPVETVAPVEPKSPNETFHSPAPVTATVDNNDVISSNDENAQG